MPGLRILGPAWARAPRADEGACPAGWAARRQEEKELAQKEKEPTQEVETVQTAVSAASNFVEALSEARVLRSLTAAQSPSGRKPVVTAALAVGLLTLG
jgi:hypothetical protein